MLQVNFQPFPEITTNRLLLRKISKNDVTEVFNLRSSDKITQFIDRPRAITNRRRAWGFIDMIINALANNEGIAWAITLKDRSKTYWYHWPHGV